MAHPTSAPAHSSIAEILATRPDLQRLLERLAKLPPNYIITDRTGQVITGLVDSVYEGWDVLVSLERDDRQSLYMRPETAEHGNHLGTGVIDPDCKVCQHRGLR